MREWFLKKMAQKMPPTNPDPESNYLSKYLVDFNQRELNKFLHPDKYPHTPLSIAALGLILFFLVAWMFPLKQQFLKSQSQQPPAQASSDRDTQNISLTGEATVKNGQQFTLVVSVRSDKQPGNHLGINVKYPTDLVDLWEVKEIDPVLKSNSGNTTAQPGSVMLDLRYPKGLQTQGQSINLVALTFQAKQTGRANIILDEIDTFLRDSSNNNLPLFKNNASVLITQ